MKVISFFISLFLLAVVLTGCTDKNNNSPVPARTDETKNDLPRVTIKLFMSDVGMYVGDDFKPDDNKYINTIKDKYNVDLIIEIPPYAEFKAKYLQLLASGDLPDIIHTNYINEIDNYGKKGAFIPLNNYIDKSPVFKDMYDALTLFAITADDGNIYSIPQMNAKKVGQFSCIARMDLIDELNGGMVPKTPDEWYELMLKEKAKYPESIPFPLQTGFTYGTLFFEAFGVVPTYNVNPYFTIEADDSATTNFEKKEYSQAVEFYRKLYANGMINKDFPTTGSDVRSNLFIQKKGLCFNGAPDKLMVSAEYAKKNDPKIVFQYVQHPAVPGVDTNRVLNNKQLLINSQRITISASSKNQDRAFSILEYMASPEWRDIVFWGIEGEGYSEKYGKRVLNIDNWQKDNYRRIYAFIVGYSAVPDVVYANMIDSFSFDSFKKTFDSIDIANSEGERRGYYPFELKPYKKDEGEKLNEAYNYIVSSTMKAVTGEISMQEFDTLVKNYKKLYGDITESQEKWWKQNKYKLNVLMK